MRLPDPIANTTTEAYLAYKAGVLEESELKPKLYYPTDHFDAWLALWAGLTTEYPTRGCISSNKLKLVANNTPAYGVGCKPIVSPTVRLYGTATKSDGISIAQNLEPDLPIGEYTFTLDSAQSGVVNLIATTEEDGNIAFRLAAGETYITKTLPSKVVKLQLFVGITNGDNYDDVSFKCALTEGSSQATVFEPSVEPEMLTDEEALVAYLAGVTDTYPDSVKDPYDVRIAGYLRYLISARFGRPEYPVNNSELYLSMLKPPIVTNETPSSDIKLEGTCDAKFIDAKLYGDTSEKVYTGKNRIRMFPYSSSKNGVTYTNNYGVLSCKGTATGRSDFMQYEPLEGYGIESGQTYTLSTNYALPERVEVHINFYSDSGWVADGWILTPGQTTKTKAVTIPATATRVRVELTITEAGSVNFVNLKPQLELGSTATEFEPFCGDIPSPNPDYPQELKCVTGEQTVTVINKNLAKPYQDSGYVEDGGVRLTMNGDGTITLNGTATDGSWLEFCGDFLSHTVLKDSPFIKLDPTKTYTLSYDVKSGTVTGGDSYVWVQYGYPSDETSLRLRGTNASKSFTGKDGLYRLWIRTYPNTVYDNFVIGVQVEEGSTATSFEPSTFQDFPLDLGLGLELVYTGSITNNNVIMKALGDNKFMFDGTEGVRSYWHSLPFPLQTGGGANNGSIQWPLDPSINYKLSAKIISGTSSNNNFPSFAIQYTTNAAGAKETSCALNRSTVFTTPDTGAGVIRCWHRVDAGVVLDKLVVEFDLEEEDKPDIRLYEIGEYSDSIYRNADGDWILHKEIGDVDIDVENIKDFNAHGGSSYVTVNYNLSSAKQMSTNQKIGAASATFRAASNYQTWGGTMLNAVCSASNGHYLQFSFPYSTGSNLADIKTYMANHPTRVHYVLDEPVETVITYPDLVAQLEAIHNAHSLDGDTYIKVMAKDPDMPARLVIEAGV